MSLDYHFYKSQFELKKSLLNKSINFFKNKERNKTSADPKLFNGRVLVKTYFLFLINAVFIYQKIWKSQVTKNIKQQKLHLNQRETVHL